MKNGNGEDLCKSCGAILEDSPPDAEGMCFQCWEKKQINNPKDFSKILNPEFWGVYINTIDHPIIGSYLSSKKAMKVMLILFGIISSCLIIVFIAAVMTT